MMIQSFAPIADDKSKLLILGTMPGEISLKLNQYYGHQGNHFWKILYGLHSEPVSKNYELKRTLLTKNGIALWDVLRACIRTGSSDSAILKEVPNDFDDFFKKHHSINRIYFNGKKAKLFYDKHVKNYYGKKTIILPSTSSANTWATFDSKLESWKAILQ